MDRRTRKNYINPGRWEVSRERFRLADSVPPDDGKGVKTIGMILPGILKGIKPKTSGIIFMIEQKWPEIAGRFAGHSKPAKVEKGILTVYVDSSSWLSEMSRFGKRQILLSLDKSIGKDIVTGLAFVLDPD